MANKRGLLTAVTITWIAQRVVDPFKGTYELYDPAIPTLVIVAPDGTRNVYTYPADILIVKSVATGETVGYYSATFLLSLAGTWQWKWLDPDPAYQGWIEGSVVAVAGKIAA